MAQCFLWAFPLRLCDVTASAVGYFGFDVTADLKVLDAPKSALEWKQEGFLGVVEGVQSGFGVSWNLIEDRRDFDIHAQLNLNNETSAHCIFPESSYTIHHIAIVIL